MQTNIDVLGLGCVAVDDFLYVDAYPEPDLKVPLKRRDRQCGGLTATALVAASRLGAQCAYAGSMGEDELSEFVVRQMESEGVDMNLMRRHPGTRPVHATVVVDEKNHTRTIFYDLQGTCGAEDDWPPEDVICRSRVLFVDHFGVVGMVRAAEIASRAGIPVVADLESDRSDGFETLLNLVDHLIIGRTFATRLTQKEDPEALLKVLWHDDRAVVVLTDGDQGCWYCEKDNPGEMKHVGAFEVEVVDTTGCGDVFHGAYAAMLAQGMALADRIQFASGTAALKATRPGGQHGIPDLERVEAFLKEHSG